MVPPLKTDRLDVHLERLSIAPDPHLDSIAFTQVKVQAPGAGAAEASTLGVEVGRKELHGELHLSRYARDGGC